MLVSVRLLSVLVVLLVVLGCSVCGSDAFSAPKKKSDGMCVCMRVWV
jgi:hypothetical protein